MADTTDRTPASVENDAPDYPRATHPNHWERHGHAGEPCPTDGSCYGGATYIIPSATT